MTDSSFIASRPGLEQALEAVLVPPSGSEQPQLPNNLPNKGIGEEATLEILAPIVIGGARHLAAPGAFAHMDPPTPWISWATTFWNASLNQNLLHPDLSPVAKDIERRVIDWLSPFYGMDGGHMTPGSTVSNLTALWAARDLNGIKIVVASDASHLSIAKATHLLGLEYLSVATDTSGRLDTTKLPTDLSSAALVLTAGTTNAGAIDNLQLAERASWTHVDAAWSGPLRLSQKHASKLVGIDKADSISISAHKLFFQPKEAGMIFFRATEKAHSAVSFGGSYLSVPNVGVLGSHGAIAVPLLATLMSWGQSGLAERIDRAMLLAETLWSKLDTHPKVELFGPQSSGVILWRPHNQSGLGSIIERLPIGSTSITSVDGKQWLRNVAANPCANIDELWPKIERALKKY